MEQKFATNIEKAIVFAWNGKPMDGFEKEEKKALQVVNFLKKRGITGVAKHTGNNMYPASLYWQNNGISSTRSKTDIVIGDYNISIKYKKSLLTSIKKNNIHATFSAVINDMNLNNTSMINEIEKLISNFVIDGISLTTIRKAKKTDIDIQIADKIHKEATKYLIKYFNSNKDFKNKFTHEILTGHLLFGDGSEARATELLHIDRSISLYSLDDMNFIKKIANNINISISFSSAALKSWDKLGQYRYWTTLKLIIDNIRKSVNESVNIKSIIKNVLKSIKSYWKDRFENILDFFGITPVIKFNNKFEI